MDIPLQIGNKEKAEKISNNNHIPEHTNYLNTEESLPKTDYTNNYNNNNSFNKNVLNNLNTNFNTTKNNENYNNYTYLDTNTANSVEIKPTDNTTSEIRFNNTPISNTFRRNQSNREAESKEETMGYLKNLKEEMKKFTEFNFDFENLNKNKTPEFKEVNKYNLNYQMNQESNLNNSNNYNNNNNYYANAISTPYEYNCTYTLHNENNNSNKEIVYDKPYDSFSNNNYDNASSNMNKNNPNLDSVNFSKISNNTKLENLNQNKINDTVIYLNF